MKTIVALVILSMIIPIYSFAFGWEDLWYSKNQQAANLLNKGKAKQAAQLFSIPLWKGVANYRSGGYKQAVDDFRNKNTALANYNRGNAYAHLGDYKAALQAYNDALKLNPHYKDAAFNKEIIKKLMKQKPQQSSQQNKRSKQNKSESDKQKQQSNTKSMENKQQESQAGKKQNQNKSAQENKRHNQQAKNKHQNDKAQSKKKKQQQAMNNKASEQKQVKKKAGQPQDKMTQTQKQALKQWMQQIPDNPGGLLQRKFLRDHWRLQQEKRG